MTPSEKQQSLDILTRRYGEQKAQVTAIDTRLAEYFDGLIAEPQYHNGARKNSTIVKKMVSNLWKMAEKFAYMRKKQYLCTAFNKYGRSLYAIGLIAVLSLTLIRSLYCVTYRVAQWQPIFVESSAIWRPLFVACNIKHYSIMTNAAIEGIQNPIQEISSKLSNYFRTRGFKQEGQFDKFGCDGDFAFEVSGTIDDIQVQVVYQDYKPRKLVVRELLALDERISNVDAYRFLSNENYREELGRIELEPIFVMIDGKLMQTTIYEYVQYGARNKDFTRC